MAMTVRRYPTPQRRRHPAQPTSVEAWVLAWYEWSSQQRLDPSHTMDTSTHTHIRYTSAYTQYMIVYAYQTVGGRWQPACSVHATNPVHTRERPQGSRNKTATLARYLIPVTKSSLASRGAQDGVRKSVAQCEQPGCHQPQPTSAFQRSHHPSPLTSMGLSGQAKLRTLRAQMQTCHSYEKSPPLVRQNQLNIPTILYEWSSQQRLDPSHTMDTSTHTHIRYTMYM